MGRKQNTRQNILVMKTKHSTNAIMAAVAVALIVTTMTVSGQTTTPESVKTRIGDLKFEQGYPTEETARKVFDDIDYQRGVQAYLWAYSAVSFESIRVACKDAGVDRNDLFIADNFADTNGVWLTANDTTIYALANIDLGKDGPVVVEIPPGSIAGLIDDFWQKSISDIGLPGPDGDQGGKFLLVPPGYTGDIPQSGYHVLKATTNNYNAMVRGIIVKGDKDGAVQNVKRVKVYPYSQRDNPKANKFISMSGVKINTLPPQGLEFWARLSAFINNNPVQERDRFFMATIKPLGIEKGKEFKPDARQTAILEEAARAGDAMGRVMLFDGHERFPGMNAFAGSHWNWIQPMDPTQEAEHYSQLDERLHYTYGAIYTSPGIGVKKAGPGSQYVQAFKDKEGNRLDGGKSYRMHVTANVPAAAFWSVTLYDTALRSMVQNPSNDSAKSSYDKLKPNADGSVDLYFAPTAPAGQESNWIQTVPGKGFYPMMRFYSPKEGLFDGTWKLPDVELTK
jgi:hypothetical protein